MNHQRPLSFAVRSLLLLALCALPLAVHAQSATATLSGTITDQNGAAIPGVTVTVTNVGTRLKRETVTNDEGSFTVPLLPPATYTVGARREGFAPIEVPNVVLNVGDQKGLKIELKPGDVNAEVQVTGEAPLINESPAVATTIDRQFVGNLPLNGRSFQSLVLLTPGVVVIGSNSGANIGQFSVNGQRGNANYVTVDGVSANTGLTFAAGNLITQQLAGTLPGLTAVGTTSNLVSIDALAEFKIQTSTYSAEYGRQPGGQVQLVSRTGSNQFHGSVFDYVRNDLFDARNWFNAKPAPKPALRQNQFGGALSGPVFLPNIGDDGPHWYNGRDRTFFFFSYEGLRLLLPTNRNTFVPSLRLRQLAPLALQPILNALPLPTGSETTVNGVPSGIAPYITAYSTPKSFDSTNIRLDHMVKNGFNLFGRYIETSSRNLIRSFVASSILVGDRNMNRSLTIGSTISFTPNLSNELRFNYTNTKGNNSSVMDNFGGAVPIDTSALLSGHNATGVRIGSVSFNLPGSSSQVQLGDSSNSFQRQINIVDNMSLQKNGHQLNFGFDYRRLAPIWGRSTYAQNVFFFNQAAILSGTASVAIVGASQEVRPIFENLSAYFQDRWKVSRRLTLDLGLRWEINPAPRDTGGKVPVLVTGIENLPTATLAPTNAPIYKTFYKALAPRLGLSYKLSDVDGRETVLRGGFGVFYDLGSGQALSVFSGFPFSANRILVGVTYPLNASQAAPPTFPVVQLPLTNISLNALNSDLQLPYTLQWNLALERSLGHDQAVTLSYVGAAGRQLLTRKLLNNTVGGARPNPNFGALIYTTNEASSDYHALQAQFQRRLSRGLQALVNYTWSHAIDEASDEINNTLDRANADFDIRHNLTAAITYDIPRIKLGAVLGWLARDWSISATFYTQRGEPVNISIQSSLVRADGSQITLRPDLVSGIPIWVDDQSVPGGRRINIAAFQLPLDPGTTSFTRQGTLGRNVVRLPGWYQLNAAIGRTFKLSERINLELKAEAFNVPNHPIFRFYDVNFQPGSSTFGRPFGTLNSALGSNGSGLNPLYQIGGSRSMQFSARISF